MLKHLKHPNLHILLYLIPFSFIFTQNSSRPFMANSLLILYLGVLFLYLTFNNKLFPQTKNSLFLVLCIFFFTLSSLLHPNPLESLFTDRSGVIISLLLLYYFSQSGEKISKKVLFLYIGTISLFLTLHVLTSLIHSRFNDLSIITITSLPDSISLIVLFILSINYLTDNSKKKLYIGFLFLLLLANAATDFKSTSTNLYSLNKTYSSLIESLRSPKDFLIGTSPGRFQDFITKHTPNNEIIYKTTSLIPTSSQSRLLEQISTTGILFSTIILYGLWKSYQNITIDIDLDHHIHQLTRILMPLFFILIIFTPITTITTLFFAILYFYIKQHQKVNNHILVDQRIPQPLKKVLHPLVKISSISLSLFIIFMSLKSSLGESYFVKYQNHVKEDQYLLAYHNLQKAISFYPFRADYHSHYSVTNLILATKLTNENGLGNEQDRANVTELYQQSIREALAATKLEPYSSPNWHNLAITYRELIGFAENSLTFAESAYFNAIKLSPKNPMLWIDLGYTYFKAEKYADSCNANKNAITLKPDWYLPYLNTALCSQKLNQSTLVKEYLEKALSLTEVNSEEYQEVSNALKTVN